MISVIFGFFALGSKLVPLARGTSSSLSPLARFFADGFGCLPALVFVILGMAGVAVGALRAGLRAGRTEMEGGAPSAGVDGNDFRTSLILVVPADGVAGGGDMVVGSVPPGVDAEGVDADMDGVPMLLIFSVSRLGGGCG